MCHFTIGDKVSQLQSLGFTVLNHFFCPYFMWFLCVSFSSSSYLKEFGFTIPDRPIMVDDIRIRGCGKSGIESVYTSKAGQGKAKPVTVDGLPSTHTHSRTCHMNADTWHTQICDGSFLSPFSTCRWPSVTLRKVTWTPVCISGRSCQVAAVSQDQPSSLTKTGRHFPLHCFH